MSASSPFWVANHRATEASAVVYELIEIVHGLPDATPEQRSWLRARLVAAKAERDRAAAELLVACGGDA
jgi:hypothetical protein